jgi:hypothetical protein
MNIVKSIVPRVQGGTSGGWRLAEVPWAVALKPAPDNPLKASPPQSFRLPLGRISKESSCLSS